MAFKVLSDFRENFMTLKLRKDKRTNAPEALLSADFTEFSVSSCVSYVVNWEICRIHLSTLCGHWVTFGCVGARSYRFGLT